MKKENTRKCEHNNKLHITSVGTFVSVYQRFIFNIKIRTKALAIFVSAVFSLYDFVITRNC